MGAESISCKEIRPPDTLNDDGNHHIRPRVSFARCRLTGVHGLLYDPGGSFRNSTRGPGGFFEGSEASLETLTYRRENSRSVQISNSTRRWRRRSKFRTTNEHPKRLYRIPVTLVPAPMLR